MIKKRWIIYGSYGYTGSLIAEKLVDSDYEIILSGRNSVKLQHQSEQLGFNWIKADLNNLAEMNQLLGESELVIHCAGPFKYTWKKMAEACIRNNCHYIDITGEIEVFEGLKLMDKEIMEAGIMALPGAGFDVVPSDCLAGYLKSKLPDAHELELAFAGLGGGVSHGTSKTMIENLGSGGAVRRNGKIKRVPLANSVKTFDFPDGKKRTAVSIPWGDLSTAFTSTGIPDITVYMAIPKSSIKWMKLMNYMTFLFKTDLIKYILNKIIERRPAGPHKKQRETGKSYFTGTVYNKNGDSFSAGLKTPEGYRLTAAAAVLIAEKISVGKWKAGYHTPVTAFGTDLILEIKGTEREDN
ncbi:MAG: saccharopine dehydrogenase family protein [Balneolaceae bacterium]